MDMMNELDDAPEETAVAQSPSELAEAVKKLCVAVSSEDTCDAIDFEQTMAVIEAEFVYTPIAFSCGEVVSTDEQNQGSAKIFSFAKLQELSAEDTLELFGRFYREDVLKNADGSDHGNIRNFMKTGWDGVSFPDGLALARK